ncbi:MAG TPA: TonB-dependent receptor [Candidatus Solibacter sp.]|nr:TonB-dependent receptor [Candidatus Solibacter sp.]
MKRSVCVAVAASTLLLCLWVPSVVGQAVYGSILGTVTDPTGAAVNGAKVSATSQTKNVTTEVTTNDSGNYSVTHLIPDVYTIRITAQGFKVLEFKDIQVSADTGSRVDGQFQVGGSSETVEVTSEAPQLKTDRADVAIELSSQQVNELPVINRNFQSLELLTPGTQTLTGWAHAATENPQGSKQIFVDGQHFSGTGYGLDGTDNQDPILGIIIVNPSLDTITETKIATQNYDAEFGKATAGIMTAQTKSGSNEFHGSGYFYDLDPKGAATDPTSGLPVTNNWKQYGATLGGAIVKNKLFFFGGYEGTRRNSGVAMTESVPTALVKSTCLTAGSSICDLSDYTNAGFTGGAGGGSVFNPYMAVGSRTNYTTYNAGSDPSQPCSVTNPCTTQIPMSDLQLWDPTGVAEGILNLLPAPNAGGQNNGTTNNYTASGSGSFNDYQYTTRIDYTVTQKLQVFGRYTHAHFTLTGTPVFGTSIGGPGLGYLGLAGNSNINNYSLATGFNYTIGTSLLTDFRFGYFRYNPHSTKWDQSNTSAATNLGLVGLNTSDVTTAGFPALVFDQTIGVSNQGGSSDGLGEGLNVSRCNCPLIEKEQGYQFANNWTKIQGNHQFKFGVDLRHAINLRVPSDANRTGVLNFNHSGTSDGATSAIGGLDIATFLFGEVSSFNRYIGSSLEPSDEERQNRYFVYAQDTWRATHKLTVNYGLRWEFYGPEYTNGANSGGYAELPQGVIEVAGVGGISSNGNTAANYKNFAPRLGIAYEVNPKTVVRLGYGRSFDIGVFGSNFGHTVTQNLPVLANQQLTSLAGDNKTAAFNFVGTCLPTGLGYTAGNCGPADPSTAFPIVPSNGILPLFGVCAEGANPCVGPVSPHIRPDKVVVPTVDAWNATVQRQLTNTTSVEVAYIGTHGTHVFRGDGPTYNNNQPTIVGFGTLTRDQRTPYYNAFSTPYTYADGTTVNMVCCNASQGFGYAGNDGTNSYNAFQVKVNQRATKGLTLLAHYTYAKAYDNDGSYVANYSTTWGRSDFNRDSVFVFAPIYELPFGRGKQFAGNIGRAADLLIGGWQVNTALTIGSGLPWTPGYAECGQDIDTGPCRPNLVGGFHEGVTGGPGNFSYFTPVAPLSTNGATSGAFSRPQEGTFGNIQRNSFTGPGEFKTDMSFFKAFSITERVKAQFRAEFFNIFNHPVFAFNVNQGGTGTNIDQAGAGKINSLESDTTMRQFQLGVRVQF